MYKYYANRLTIHWLCSFTRKLARYHGLVCRALPYIYTRVWQSVTEEVQPYAGAKVFSHLPLNRSLHMCITTILCYHTGTKMHTSTTRFTRPAGPQRGMVYRPHLTSIPTVWSATHRLLLINPRADSPSL